MTKIEKTCGNRSFPEIKYMVMVGKPSTIVIVAQFQSGLQERGSNGDSMTSILIIVGETNLRKELTSTLTEAGFTVADVPDILEANEISELKPDLAIVDEVLPSGDGKGLCSLLHHLNIPVILMGRDDSGEACVKALGAGADFYFAKPASHQELVARVKAIMRRYYGMGRG